MAISIAGMEHVKTRPVTCRVAIFPNREGKEILCRARKTLSTCVQSLQEEQHLTSEYFVLSRLLYFKHGQLRRDKSFQGLKQIRSCLKKIMNSGLERHFKELSSDFAGGILEEGIKVHLPSRQMWQHLLVQMMRAAAVLCSAASRCAAVFLHVHRHLTTGNLISTNVLFLSLLSRIWSCCQGRRLQLQGWYKELFPALDVLMPTDVEWLPEGEVLPSDLAVWLGEQGLSMGKLTHKGEEKEDSVNVLMSEYQDLPEESATDVVSSEGALEEDFGVAVSHRERKLGRLEVDTTTVTEELKKAPVKLVGVGLKKKVLAASTIGELQHLLKRVQAKYPNCTTKKKQEKFSSLLADLESQLQASERSGDSAQANQLLVRGRKKVLKFIKITKEKSKMTEAQSVQKKMTLQKIQKKATQKNGQKMTRQSVQKTVNHQNVQKKRNRQSAQKKASQQNAQKRTKHQDVPQKRSQQNAQKKRNHQNTQQKTTNQSKQKTKHQNAQKQMKHQPLKKNKKKH